MTGPEVSAPSTERRQIAIVKSYGELVTALRARSDELQVTRETLDHITGLQNGYAAKLLAPVPIRMLGRISLGPMLAALGMSIVLVEDLSALRKIQLQMTKRLKPRLDASGAMPTGKSKKRRGVFRGNSEWGKLLAARRVALQTDKERSDSARRAARIRWRRKRTAAGRSAIEPVSAKESSSFRPSPSNEKP
jgi:hypothetical protein